MCKKKAEKLVYLQFLLYFCSRFMESEAEKRSFKAMYRRWIYMAIAILAAALLPVKPVFLFQEDKGIIYVRSFSMDQKEFVVTQTEMKTGIEQITATMSVKGLYYCYKVMLWGTILCLLCFYRRRWRIAICTAVTVVAGIYYALMIYYAIRMADLHYATLYPSWTAILPAIVLQMMLMTRQNVINSVTDDEW